LRNLISLVHVEMCAEVQQRLQQFSREVLDLLKSQGSHCRLPVSKFVSAYHQYFSRQCRVADYGFSKIIDLLLAIPKSIQVKRRRNVL
jgi:meiosis arrest female protein 1